ncbi:hypothetical protein TWF694_005896 [Orbilia ellipsospora]|uniref:HMA domain-containing protein n=1 Tax=Orbilia ellipsospora TaxID=2528407 RepID=A0AAV9WS96_9PEZI
MSKEYGFEAEMSCSGCSGAIEKVLSRWKERQHNFLEYATDLTTKTVTVTAPESLSAKDIHDKIDNVKNVSSAWEVLADGTKKYYQFKPGQIGEPYLE